MKKNIIRLFISGIFLFFISCQRDKEIISPVTYPDQFNEIYGGPDDDFCNSVIQSSDGNYIMCGSTKSIGNGIEDVWLVKTDRAGKMLWQKYYGGANMDVGKKVIETADGGFLIAGFSKSFSYIMQWEVYIIKTDASGNEQWHSLYGTTQNDCANALVACSDNSGYMICGATGGLGGYCGNNIYYSKVDFSGDTIFTRQMGGQLQESATSIIAETNGEYTLLCNTQNFGAVNWGMLILRINTNGDSLTSVLIDGPGSETGAGMKKTADGGYIIAGSSANSGSIYTDYYLVKLDAALNITWKKSYGTILFDDAFDVIETVDGGYLICGNSNGYTNGHGDPLLVKTDASGHQLWESFKGDSICNDAANVLFNADDGYLIGGYINSSNGPANATLVKMKKN